MGRDADAASKKDRSQGRPRGLGQLRPLPVLDFLQHRFITPRYSWEGKQPPPRLRPN